MTIVTLEHALKFAVVQYLDRLRLQRGATVEELESAVQILSFAFEVDTSDADQVRSVALRKATLPLVFAAGLQSLQLCQDFVTTSPLYSWYLENGTANGYFEGVTAASPDYRIRERFAAARFLSEVQLPIAMCDPPVPASVDQQGELHVPLPSLGPRSASTAGAPAAAAAAPAAAASAAASAAPASTFRSANAPEVRAEAHKNAGNVYMAANEYEHAMRCYTAAIEECPAGTSSHIFYSNRAATLCQLKDYASAVLDCERAIELAPTYGKAYSRLGLAKYSMGQYPEAVRAYKRALELNPDNALAKEQLRKAEARLHEEGKGRGSRASEAAAARGPASAPAPAPVAAAASAPPAAAARSRRSKRGKTSASSATTAAPSAAAAPASVPDSVPPFATDAASTFSSGTGGKPSVVRSASGRRKVQTGRGAARGTGTATAAPSPATAAAAGGAAAVGAAADAPTVATTTSAARAADSSAARRADAAGSGGADSAQQPLAFTFPTASEISTAFESHLRTLPPEQRVAEGERLAAGLMGPDTSMQVLESVAQHLPPSTQRSLFEWRTLAETQQGREDVDLFTAEVSVMGLFKRLWKERRPTRRMDEFERVMRESEAGRVALDDPRLEAVFRRMLRGEDVDEGIRCIDMATRVTKYLPLAQIMVLTAEGEDYH